jgi:hypothetical protein
MARFGQGDTLNGTRQSDGSYVQTVSLASTAGTAAPVGTTADPFYNRIIGAATIATSQAATSISPATSLLLVAARTGRQSVTITNITGTQPVFLVSTANATGATTGAYLGAAAGSSVTINTSAAIYGTSPTAGQTVSVLEAY